MQSAARLNSQRSSLQMDVTKAVISLNSSAQTYSILAVHICTIRHPVDLNSHEAHYTMARSQATLVVGIASFLICVGLSLYAGTPTDPVVNLWNAIKRSAIDSSLSTVVGNPVVTSKAPLETETVATSADELLPRDTASTTSDVSESLVISFPDFQFGTTTLGQDPADIYYAVCDDSTVTSTHLPSSSTESSTSTDSSAPACPAGVTVRPDDDQGENGDPAAMSSITASDSTSITSTSAVEEGDSQTTTSSASKRSINVQSTETVGYPLITAPATLGAQAASMLKDKMLDRRDTDKRLSSCSLVYCHSADCYPVLKMGDASGTPVCSPLAATGALGGAESINSCVCDNGRTINTTTGTLGPCPWTTTPLEASSSIPTQSPIEYPYTGTDPSSDVYECKSEVHQDFGGDGISADASWCAQTSDEAILSMGPRRYLLVSTSSAHVGTLTGEPLYTSISNAITSLCPSPTIEGSTSACSTGEVIIPSIVYVDKGDGVWATDGELVVTTGDSRYYNSSIWEIMVAGIAAVAKTSARNSSCSSVQAHNGLFQGVTADPSLLASQALNARSYFTSALGLPSPSAPVQIRDNVWSHIDDFDLQERDHPPPTADNPEIPLELCTTGGGAGMLWIEGFVGSNPDPHQQFLDVSWEFKQPNDGAFACDTIMEELLTIIPFIKNVKPMVKLEGADALKIFCQCVAEDKCNLKQVAQDAYQPGAG
ncbi:MAG: hypothetical protein M1820_010790 [Bogoriella megaspora]|nr:MAG: hypothetical protein M1820_010790 [Bogoriella megaspora]